MARLLPCMKAPESGVEVTGGLPIEGDGPPGPGAGGEVMDGPGLMVGGVKIGGDASGEGVGVGGGVEIVGGGANVGEGVGTTGDGGAAVGGGVATT